MCVYVNNATCRPLSLQVVTSFYTAELTAVLTLSKTELPINSLQVWEGAAFY